MVDPIAIAGRCICNKLVDPTEVCDEECLSAKPSFNLQVARLSYHFIAFFILLISSSLTTN